MVIHQRVTPYLQMLFATVVVENLEIEFFIIFVEENDLTAVASLDVW